MEQDPLARLRLFSGSPAEQVIALTDLWKRRSKRTFVAMRERMNELEDLHLTLEPAAFDNYFRRANREKTPEEVVWALIRILRDDAWLPQAQQCTLAEALYLAALKNVSVLTYARISHLFPGQEEEFNELCPLGGLIAAQMSQPQPLGTATQVMLESKRTFWPLANRQMQAIALALLVVLLLWTALSTFGLAVP